MKYRKKLVHSLYLLLLLLVTYALLCPLEIYVGNKDELLFSISDFLPILLGIAAVGIILGTLIFSVLPEKIYKPLYVLTFAFALMSYIQNMFLNSTLMRDDGGKMEWDKLQGKMVANTIIWVVVFAIVIVLSLTILKKNYIKVYSYIALAITFLELTAIASMLLSNPWKKPEDAHFSLSGEYQYSLASGDNIVILILDRYSNGHFESLMEDHPEYLGKFKDFTYYNNMDSHYAYTFPAVQHLLTGVDKDIDVNDLKKEDGSSYKDWNECAWSSNKCREFYKTIHDKGYSLNFYYSVEAYAMFGDMDNLVGKVDNASCVPLHIDKGLTVRLLEKMSLYKCLPYAVKPKFEVMSTSFSGTASYEIGVSDYQNATFYRNLCDRGLTIEDKITTGTGQECNNLINIIFIEGIHEPYTLGADGSEVPESESNLEITKQGLDVIVDKYIQELKDQGRYDNTTIIITSDHGWAPEYLDPQPVFLIKMAGETHASMITTDAPVSSDDFMPTILDIIGEDYSEYGTSIFDWHDGDKRVRTMNFLSEEGNPVYTYEGDRYDLIEQMEK